MKVWRGWIELWDRREPVTALALVRILVALVLLYDYLVMWKLDLIEPLWSLPPDGYATPNDRWAVRWFGGGPDAAFGLWLATVIALVAMAAGALTRVACVAFVLLSAQFAHLGPDADRGIDQLLRVVVAILALSRSHAMWSVDAWLWRRLGRPMSPIVPAWPRYLLFAQLVWVYFSGGHNKTGTEWGPYDGFTALANTLADPHFARFAPDWVAALHPLTRVATALTITFELTSPLLIVFTYYAATADRPGTLRRWCNRLRLRAIWIALGISFHVGIAITMQLGIFPLGMLALYPIVLLPRELDRFGARIR
ncbi:MAG: HTTM domain-containing protein [Deltaproteobacteria bacterium]|nr:HTTM domain-containing protein [Deltaproteobacteria bacterium]